MTSMLISCELTSSFSLTQGCDSTMCLGLFSLLCSALTLDLVQNTKNQLFALRAEKNNNILYNVVSL